MPKGLHHFHERKVRVIWLFYTRVTRKLRTRKNLHELLRGPQLHANCVYFDESKNIGSYSYTRSTFIFHRAKLRTCIVFLCYMAQQNVT